MKILVSNLTKPQRLLLAFTAVAVLLGIVLRCYNLKSSGFFFYDEGLYLNHNLAILEFFNKHQLHTIDDRLKAAEYYFKMALGSGKSLWFFVMDSRFLWGALYDWGFPKVMAAFFGLLTIPMVFIFCRRYSGSVCVAAFAAALFAILPGSVFYSRIGLQEAFSTFLVLSGLYLYMFPRTFGWRTFVAGVVLAAAFFSNYRLIMLPLLVLFYELWVTFVQKDPPAWRKYVWFFLSFMTCVILAGNLLGGVNTTVIAAWVFHQGKTAGGEFAWINFLSYPYYFFRLETWLFGVFFFGNIYFLVLRRWVEALPFALVMFQMLFFSFPEDKAARYIAVMLPFAVMAVALLAREIWHRLGTDQRHVFLAVLVLLGVLMAGKSIQLAQASSDHEKAVMYLLEKDPQVKFLSSQELVQDLYVFPHDRVRGVPARFEDLVTLYSKGYHYLVLDPQSYISLVDEHKFTRPLRDYLSFIESKGVPIKVFPHMNDAILERFVFEHSTNLWTSVNFLASEDIRQIAALRIYDLDQIVPVMMKLYEQLKQARR